MEMSRHCVVTGAGGFIGRRLCAALLEDARYANARFTFVDLSLADVSSHPRVSVLEGDIADASLRVRLSSSRVDVLFHLAGILGGAAEENYELSRVANVDATLSLFEDLRDPADPPRVVYASSVAVFGPATANLVDDNTSPSPLMTYGAQKLMMEVALTQFSVCGWLDGIALRLPGIVARPNADARLKSAFLNNVFFAFARGEAFVLPVSPEGTTWLISLPTCVEAFLRAGILPAEAIGPQRAFTLPAQRVRIGDLVAALGRRFPFSKAQISYRPEAALQDQFASQPALRTAIADSLGFRHDGNIDTLVDRALPLRLLAEIAGMRSSDIPS